MSTASQHYRRAEELIEAGRSVVTKISKLSMDRVAITASKPNGDLGGLGPHDRARVENLTQRMDEYGKKAMGIWAQAQVHATLATVDPSIAKDQSAVEVPES